MVPITPFWGCWLMDYSGNNVFLSNIPLKAPYLKHYNQKQEIWDLIISPKKNYTQLQLYNMEYI